MAEQTAHERLMQGLIAAMAASTRTPLLDIKVTVGAVDLDAELGELRALRSAVADFLDAVPQRSASITD